ncbi:hypothetical protein ACP70R_011860 [Stipagrostis hirtigluma subsp. patula]
MANPAAPGRMRSFLQAVSTVTEEAPTPLRVVQMEGLAVLKIIKHCEEFAPSLVTGQLLGLDVGSVLEVTNCFPFPMREDDEEADTDGANYQLEMMRCLREVNVDNNTIGWVSVLFAWIFSNCGTDRNIHELSGGGMEGIQAYILTYFKKYQEIYAFSLLVSTLLEENIRRCVCIVYDPSRSSQGVLALKALKLTDSFMDLYRNNGLTGEKLREKKVSWVDIFEEIPIKVSNSALVSAFMKELEPESPVTQCDFDRLKLSTAPFMERNLEFLIGCMDDLSSEQNKFQYYYRNLSRQQSQQQAWLQKRRQENMARKAAGEEPLPEEDPSNPIFKPIPEPSRLEGYLVTNQISSYCNHINVQSC